MPRARSRSRRANSRARGLRARQLLDDETLAQIQLRREAIEAQELHSSILRARSNARAVATQRFDAILPLRDRHERPVVRVYVDTSTRRDLSYEIPSRTRTSAALIQSTSKRTYHFVTPVFAPSVEDPAIPTVGALVIVDSDERLSILRAQSIASLSAQNLSTPMIWIYGPDPNKRARAELLVRSWLTNAGFAGDEALAVSSEHRDATAFCAVIDAMDTHFIEARWPPLLAHRPAALSHQRNDRALATLDALIEDHDDAGVKKILQIAARDSAKSAGAKEQLIAARAARALSWAPIRSTALTLCALALRREDAAPLVEWLARACEGRRQLTADLMSAARTLIALEVEAVIPPLVALFDRCMSNDYRSSTIAGLFEPVESTSFARATIAEFASYQARWAATDTRARYADQLTAKLARRVEFAEDERRARQRRRARR
ncbi:MAG: hypothetical protein U0269_03415 [Polyangiales bacterium]